jgi:hypothetical protein
MEVMLGLADNTQDKALDQADAKGWHIVDSCGEPNLE